jgi:rSAM/selenodomain-associated transferase 2
MSVHNSSGGSAGHRAAAGVSSRAVKHRVSIVVPALNEAAGIAQAVARAWALGPQEIIVVDGGSRDDTVVLASAAGAQMIESPRGRAVQQNAGARAAVGDVLLFLHADTWLEPGALEQAATALDDERTVAGAFRQRIDAEGVFYRWLERGNAWRVARGGPAYGDQGIFLRRELFEALGGFPAEPFLEDLLLMRRVRRRLAANGGRLALLPGPLHVSPRRWQRHGVIRQTLRNWSILAAHQAGVSPARLAGWYRQHG